MTLKKACVIFVTLGLFGGLMLATLPAQGMGFSGGGPTPQGGVYMPMVLRSGANPTPAVGLLNGDFEQGRSVWTEYSLKGWTLIVQGTSLPGGVTPHSGTWAAWLGGDSDETSYIEQQVFVSPTLPHLKYFRWISSADTCGFDVAKVMVNGTVVEQFDLCTGNQTPTWTYTSVSLVDYIGQTVTLRIQVTTDGSSNSNLFLDDLTLQSAPAK